MGSISIGRKIVGLSVVTLSLMLAAAIYAFVQTSRVHPFTNELVTLVEPLAHDVAAIKGTMLQKALMVERALRHVGPALTDEKAGQAELERFKMLSDGVLSQVRQAHQLLQTGAAKTDRPEIARELAKLELELETVAREHATYDAAAVRLLMAPKADPQTQKLQELAVTAGEDRLVESLERLNARVSNLARHDEVQLDSLQNRVFLVSSENLVVAIFAFLAGTLLSSMITRRMLQPVHNLIAGTEEIGRGNLDVTFPGGGKDEVGKLNTAFQHMVSELRSKAVLRETFGSYVDPRVVDRLMGDGREAIEAGERREMTVLFADLEGFSGIAETLTPTSLVRLINSYLALASEPIAEHQGVIDKYIGDAVMAFWGPPFTEGDFALHACRAALAQGGKLEELRAMLPELLGLRRGAPKINVRIGISTGDVVVGSIGAQFSKSFTVIGDTVNIASRLESANKYYGTSILVDEATHDRVKSQINTREIDTLVVAGKQEPVRIYELMGFKDEGDPTRAQLSEIFGRALTAYRGRDWKRAEKAFLEGLAVAPDDQPTILFLDRVRSFEANPPGPGWDGSWKGVAK